MSSTDRDRERVADFECLMMPFCTVLGVFTILVPRRDSVRSLFGLLAVVPGHMATDATSSTEG